MRFVNKTIFICLFVFVLFLVSICKNNKNDNNKDNESFLDIHLSEPKEEYTSFDIEFNENEIYLDACFKEESEIKTLSLSNDIENEVIIELKFDMNKLIYFSYIKVIDINNEVIEEKNITTNAFINDWGFLDGFVVLSDDCSFYISDYYNINDVISTKFNWLRKVTLVARSYFYVTECAEQIKSKLNYSYNKKIEANNNGVKIGNYILNQKEKSKQDYKSGDYKFGFTTFSNVGCEVAAAYNLMITLDKKEYLSKTIYEFERYSIEFSFGFGKFGSNPLEIYRYLDFNDISYDKYINWNNFKNEINNKKNCRIIMSSWNNPITDGLHTFYIEKKDGTYYAYNYDTENSIKESDSINYFNYRFIVGYII